MCSENDKYIKAIEKYKHGEFHTDSDIRDFTEENGLSLKTLLHLIDELNTKGTPCEGCKHISFSSGVSMYPCNCCSRRSKDMYEEEYDNV